jgi:hypothetical protein
MPLRGMFLLFINPITKEPTMLDQLALFIKAVLASALVVVAMSSIYLYRVWLKDTSRKVKISVLGFSIELGEAKKDSIIKDKQEENTKEIIIP